MFISKDLLFLEMQKTGGSHILKLLEDLTDGTSVGKHNRLSDEHIGRFTFGSIRNPWDWYVSLWAFGVGGKGAIRSQVVKGVEFDYYYRILPKSMGKNWLTFNQFYCALRHDLMKPRKVWASVYEDPNNASQFRAWLKMVLNPKFHYDIGEGFAFSPVSAFTGLMTYRYLRLFTPGNALYHDQRLTNLETLVDYDEEFNISGGMIRTENLEEDFIRILSLAGCELTSKQVDNINSSTKTNSSKRKLATYYYDQETLDLVANKEKFLIEKFKYSPPVLNSNLNMLAS